VAGVGSCGSCSSGFVFPGREGGRGGIFTKKTDSGVLAQEDLLVKYTATVDVRMDVPYSICSPVAVCAQDTHPFWRYVNWGKQGFLVV
jgi:hypothetical protein